MNRTLRMERVFSLGDYKSIRFGDEINELPEEVMLNPDLTDRIRYLQMVNTQLAYEQYVALYRKINSMSDDEARLNFLTEAKTKTLEDIRHILFKE